jgi:heme A synthase
VATLPPTGVGLRGVTGSPSLFVAALIASGSTNLELTNPLVWAMVAISVAGSIVTFAFLVYAIWKFRDPKVKHRRYG